jgi:PleD family two-component response regulator
MKVLIVDGNRERRLAIKRMLETKFLVTTLSSAEEAIAFSRSRWCDIIIVSESINSSISPAALLAMLRRLNSAYFVPLLLTGPSAQDVNAGGAFVKTIAFPFSADDLYEMVATVES